MNIAKSTILFISGIASLTMSSCKKEKQCMAGSGGSVDLILFPEHHEESIPGTVGYLDSAFIKFNSRDFPGDDPAKYDLVLSGAVGSDSIIVQGLKCGNYYLFATGFDTSISERVKGGIPFTIAEGASGIKNVVVPVTEN